MVFYSLIKKKKPFKFQFFNIWDGNKKKLDNYIFFQYLKDKNYNIYSD